MRGLDIGCGASLIYCLLGAAGQGWHMTGADVTPAALDGAAANMRLNPQLAHLLQLRASACVAGELPIRSSGGGVNDALHQPPGPVAGALRGRVLLGGEKGAAGDAAASVEEAVTYHFCMCNPPFFESLEEAGLNPRTDCGGALRCTMN